jgi:glycosyltransferase involved in cell wall biosynthesis
VAPLDVLVVSHDHTLGWRAAANALAQAFSRSGASVQRASNGPVAPVRTFVMTDYVEARAARDAAQRAIAAHRPRAVVYCSITAALLWPEPGVIWFDCLAAENRPGRHGLWQRTVERRRLAEARLVLTMSERSLDPLKGRRPASIVVPVPVDPSGPPSEQRDILAVTYAGNPDKRRLEFVLDTWRRARRPGETLLVAGLDSLPFRVQGVEPAGRLPADDYRALLRRARVFIAAPKREDFGIAPLEALADGCQLVTTPAPGPYPARDIARRLDPRLVADDLTAPIRAAIDEPRAEYAAAAAAELEPFTREAVDRTIAHDVLPRLLGR